MSELKNHVSTSEPRSMTRLESQLLTSLSVFAVIFFILLIMPAQASALDITSRMTEKHVMVPGTNAYFAPPLGLSLASEFSGFESRNRNIEVIVAFLEGAMHGIEEGFTEESFASLGMNLLAKGEFTIDSQRAVLYKILHDDGNMKWGKWVMLAANGPGTLVVNAVFVSGDTDASLELEQMLKGLYMERSTAAGAPTTRPVYSATPSGAASNASPAGNNEQDGFDRMEAISILAGETPPPPRTASHEESGQPSPENNSGDETDNAGQEIRGSARIITEDGVIHAGDSTAAGE